MTNIETQKKDKPTGKSVLLFSGGMDSLIMNYLLKPDILLVIPHENAYQEQELAIIEKLIESGSIDKEKVVFDYSLNLRYFERDDAIIPNRNLYFITLASHYGETIYLGSIHGDRSLDKSKEFFKKCENMFNYLFQEQHWCKKRNFSISAPYKNYTKTKLVKLFLEKGGNPRDLLISYSCYEGHSKHCGRCKPCFRKWVALENNNINIDNYFDKKPEESPWLTHILPLVLKNNYRGEEDIEIQRALRKRGKLK